MLKTLSYLTSYEYILFFSERVGQVSKHDEEHYAGPAEQNDGTSHDGTLAKET